MHYINDDSFFRTIYQNNSIILENQHSLGYEEDTL